MRSKSLLSVGSIILSLALFLLACASISEALPVSSVAKASASLPGGSHSVIQDHPQARKPGPKRRSCKSKNGGLGSGSSSTSSSSSSARPSPSSHDKSQGQTQASGVIRATQNPKLTKEYLQGGVQSSGWNPPRVSQNDIRMLSDGQADSVSMWSHCTEWKDIFQQAAQDNGLPVVVLYSFAYEESTCRPNANSGGDHGTQGLMQLDEEKCKAAPGGNCYDVSYNVNRGAKYFKDTLQAAGGNWDEALGTYNGWYKGMTGSPAGQNLNYISDQINYSYLGMPPPGQ